MKFVLVILIFILSEASLRAEDKCRPNRREENLRSLGRGMAEDARLAEQQLKSRLSEALYREIGDTYRPTYEAVLLIVFADEKYLPEKIKAFENVGLRVSVEPLKKENRAFYYRMKVSGPDHWHFKNILYNSSIIWAGTAAEGQLIASKLREYLRKESQSSS